jgi:hypothetical protein
MKPLRVSLVAILLLIVGVVRADGPADNIPEKVRPVPPAGVMVPDEVRAKLEAGLAEFAARVEKLRGMKEQVVVDNLPDVLVYHKAVRDALDHGEFFSDKEFPVAEGILSRGLARAAALLEKSAPWTTETGLVVRGYTSKIDGSVQPYGLVIPPSYTDKTAAKYRLDVWCHGRGEVLSELNFIAGAEKNRGIFTPADTIVLHPYGRYCNAFKFAGEVDVLEGMASVQKRYRVDEDRIAIRGFSMGGAGCWQLAVHYPDLWVGNTPGAGFSETPDFLKVFQKETLTPTWYEQTLWQWYDCPVYAANLANLPTIAYSGDKDTQIQAARMMEQAYEKEGMSLLHIIGPDTAHSYHPAARDEIDRRLSLIAAKGRDKVPSRVHLTTPTLRYNRQHWLTVDGLAEHWVPARIDAGIVGTEAFAVVTSGITAFSIRIPSGHAEFDPTKPVPVVVDGTELAGPKPGSDRSFEVSIHKDGREWKVGPAPVEGNVKKHGLQGPIDDAFMDSFLIVRPSKTAAHPEIQKWVDAEMNRAIKEWRRHFRGVPRVKLDTEVTDADIAAHHLVLWGDPASNSVLAKVLEKLPIGWTADEVSIGAAKHAAATHVPLAIQPNPLNPAKYVVLNSGFTYREYDYLNNARQVAKLPDWAIIDVTTPPNSRYPGKVVAADFFDETWKVKPAGPRSPPAGE